MTPARARPMPLDGHSVQADAEQTDARTSAVQAVILGRFAECGPMTDDALVQAYDRARATHPDIPKASPQSIRSRRAELHHRGIIRATNLPGVSAYGRPATVWALAATAREAACLF